MEPAGRVSSPLRAADGLLELLAFALGAMRSPTQVGAIVPASRWLAGAVAAAVGRSGCRTVVEIGAGTGALTRAILAQVEPPERYVAIENDPRFAAWLRRRMPRLDVVQGCASQIPHLIEPGVATAIVSSLPFRSLPSAQRARCAEALAAALSLSEHSVLIQYSYGFGTAPPFDAPAGRLRWARSQRVPFNLPPATVWTLRDAHRAPD